MEARSGEGKAATGNSVEPSAEARARGGLISELLDASPEDPSHVLTPIAALREVVAVCGSIKAGRGAPGMADRRSLRSDVQLALTSTGGELRTQLQPSWRDFFQGELGELPVLLDSSGGVSRLQAAAEVLVEQLRDPRVAQAAWRDLFGWDNGSTTVDEAKHWTAVLHEIDEGRGHEWTWRAGRLRRAAFSESWDEGEEILGEAPVFTAKVAWFVFADADLANGYLRVGQVQFFSGRLWPAGVMSPDFLATYPDSEHPEELDDDALDQWFRVRRFF